MRVIWSASSLEDLRSIDQYLSRYDVEAAVRILTAIREKAAFLQSYPHIGPALEGGLRYLSVGKSHYVLLYRAFETVVEVVRVRHSSENWWSSATEQ